MDVNPCTALVTTPVEVASVSGSAWQARKGQRHAVENSSSGPARSCVSGG